MQLRPDDFSEVLKEIGFVDEEGLGETGEGGTSKTQIFDLSVRNQLLLE